MTEGSGASTPKRRGRAIGIVLMSVTAIGLVVAVSAFAWAASLDPLPISDARRVSTTVSDHRGKLLRAYAMQDGRWRLAINARKDVDPGYLNILLAYEDRRFESHVGVDFFALSRAAVQLITQRHIVSGGSTITMQLARLMEPRRERSISAKLRQIVRAIQLERQFSKDEILDLYLTLAPFGGNLEGVRAASLAYFGKEPKRLTLGEAALLVALPQSPETRRLDRFADQARNARDRVLARMVGEGRVSAEDATRALGEPVPRTRKPMPLLAPHATDQALAAMRDASAIHLTLDATIQQSFESLARDRAASFGPNVSIGILAVDHRSGDVIAHIGSPDYFNVRRAGQVDMTRAVRSPGSTLKPFIYGMAFEDGFINPESLIDDRPVRYGNYAPRNFDTTYQGTVSVRRALQLSLNVPAVALLDRVGASRLSARIRQSGANLILPENEVPGLAMGLGGVGMTLTDMVKLYGGLARLGTTVSLREVITDGSRDLDARRLLDPGAAWQVGNVLIGTPPPENAVAHRIAFKTGTSYGYRDAWSVGFDGCYVIGVWVGRPDGAPVPGLIGRAAAAPILFDAFARTGKLPVPLPKPPKDVLVATNARLPLPLQRFRPAGDLLKAGGEQALRIQYPLNGSRIDVSEAVPTGQIPLPVKVSGGVLPMTMLVNGVAVGELDTRRQRMVDPPGPGFARLTVMDAAGAVDTVVIRIQGQ